MAIRYIDEAPAKSKIRYLDEAPAAPQKASAVDLAAGSPLGQMALGAADTVIGGPLQLGANLGSVVNRRVVAPIAEAMGAEGVARRARRYGSTVADKLAEGREALGESEERGREELGTSKGWRVGGSILGGVAGAGKKAATTLGGKVAQGAGLGGFFGATAPVDSDNYWGTKAVQAGTGAVVGGALPLATGLASKVVRTARDTYDVVRGHPQGLDRLRKAYYERLVGKDHVASVADDLRNVDPILPGGKPTAAEAVSANPFGSPVQAQQRATLSTAGGPSGEAGARMGNQAIVRGSADIERELVTAPMREAALKAASNINPTPLVADVRAIVTNPEVQAVTPLRNFLSGVEKDIQLASGDAKSLYAVRKHIGDLIEGRAESEQNVAKYASTQLMAMKKAIDKAIEDGGAGGQWKDYLSEYARRSRLIDKSTDRAAAMYTPAQKTVVPGADAVAEATSTHLPNLLSRPAMIANYVARMARRNVEPKLDAAMARDFLNPKQMADIMEPQASPLTRALRNAIAKKAGLAGSIAAAESLKGSN